MRNPLKKAALLAPAGAVAAALLAPIPASAAITVDVNGRPVQFTGVQPARIEGRVLIPLRAVVESLGAEIKWEPSTQTVRGSKGEREFSLQIGSRNAMVNGNASTLDVPAQLISGTTMVPLRFVAEALGAEVEWNAADQRVAINTPLDQEMPGTNRVTGEVAAVRAGDNPPTVTVNVNGVRNTYQVRADTIVLRGEEGARGRQVDLDQLREGDRVQLRVNPDTGTAEVVEAFYPRGAQPPPVAARDVAGEVIAVRTTGGVRTVTVRTETGRETFTVPEKAPIVRAADDRPASDATLQDIKIGDSVRLSAQGDLVSRLEATAPGANPPKEGEVVGEVIAVRENPPSITVRSGNDRVAYDLNAQSVVLRKTGTGQSARAQLRQIQPGDQVRIQLDPTGTVARVVDATAPAVDPQPSGDIQVTRLTHNAPANQALAAGSRINVVLEGTPGGIATVDVGTFARGVELREAPQRPGRYTGTVTIPEDVTAKDVTLIGQIRKGNATSPLLQAPVTVSIDSQAPSITEVAPPDRTTVTNRLPDIYAEISDAGGSGIDSRSLRMTVRGKDVSSEVRVTNRFILYTPKTALAPGAVPVVVSLKDAAGNTEQITWRFTISPKAAVVESVSHNADKALRVGDVLEVTAKGQPKGRATFSVGEAVRGVAMKETAAGTYVGTYTVKRGDQLLKAPVVVEIVSPAGVRSQLEATAPVNLVTQDPKPAAITAPAKTFDLSQPLVVQGTAEPNSKVLVEVKYSGRAIGFLPVSGTFGQQEVTVNRNGRWRTEPFEVRLPLGLRRPNLQITAVTVDAAGTESKPATVEVETR